MIDSHDNSEDEGEDEGEDEDEDQTKAMATAMKLQVIMMTGAWGLKPSHCGKSAKPKSMTLDSVPTSRSLILFLVVVLGLRLRLIVR